jgi:chromosome segregation ATPase
MLFFKKDRDRLKDLKNSIESHESSIYSLHTRIDFLAGEARSLSLKVSQNSEAILEVDDKSEGGSELWCNTYDTLEAEISKFANEIRDQVSKIESSHSSILKMQRAIITWIIMLSATSIFSFLLYWEII